MLSNEIRKIENQVRFHDWADKLYSCRNEKLTNWVTSFHPDKLACRLAHDSADDDWKGNFNWCVRVIFSNEDSWIVRFPQGGSVAVPDEKVECEVAAIMLIRQHTDIPVPAVKAWGLSHENALGLGPFMMSQFVEGVSLGGILQDPEAKHRSMADNIEDRMLEKIYRQIAKFQLQLASLDFSHIGGLSCSMQRDDESKIITVDKRPLTLRAHSILKLGDVDVLGLSNATFAHATEYFEHITQGNMTHLREQPNSTDDEDDARQRYRYWTAMHKLAPKVLMSEFNNGPFKLICDDFTPANMIVNNAEDLEIIAVIDWEWSYAGPLQLYWSPPRWLLLQQPDYWKKDEERLDRYKHCLFLYLRILEDEEENSPNLISEARPRGSSLIKQAWQDGKIWYHHILLGSFHHISDVPYRELKAVAPELDDLANAVPAQEVEVFVEMKMEQLRTYKADLPKKTEEYLQYVRAYLDREAEEKYQTGRAILAEENEAEVQLFKANPGEGDDDEQLQLFKAKLAKEADAKLHFLKEALEARKERAVPKYMAILEED